MDPTQEQLQARLNPTSTQVQTPTSGLFRAQGSVGGLYSLQNGKLSFYDPTELLSNAASYGNYGAQTSAANQLLKTQYGIDYGSLPTVNIADLGLAPDANGHLASQGNLQDFLKLAPASLTTQTINNTPNIAYQPGSSAYDASLASTTQKKVAPPSTNLQPGQSGQDVVQLQNWLISQGYQIPDGATGYFGDQTKAALTKWQQANGVKAGQNFGYYGPLTREAIAGPQPADYSNISIGTGNLSGTGTANNFSTASTPQIPNIQNIGTTPTAQLSPTEQSAQNLSTQLQTLTNQLVGKSTYQQQQEQNYGVNSIQNSINDLTAQLTGLKNEAAAIPLQLQQGAAANGVTTSLLGAQENSRLRTNAIAALGVSTLLSAAQGQLANAQSMADKAVAAKYDPIQEQIDALATNLKIIQTSPQYTADQKAQAAQQELALRDKQAQLDDARAATKSILDIATKSAANITSFTPTTQYPTASVALNAIQNASSPVEAARISALTGLSGASQGDNWSAPYLLGNNYVQQNKATGEIRNVVSAGGSGSDANRILSPSEAQALGVPYGTTQGQAYGRTPTKPITDSQSKDATYASRVSDSNSIISSLASNVSSYNPAQFLAEVSAENTTVGNAFVSDTIKQLRQAERDFVNAVLRRESGAVISPSEFANAEKQYFPQPGDDAKTLAQKAQSRQNALNGLIQGAGPAYTGGSSGGFASSSNTGGGGIIPSANASGYAPGSVIKSGNTLYLVGADGETITPVGSAQ